MERWESRKTMAVGGRGQKIFVVNGKKRIFVRKHMRANSKESGNRVE